LFLSVYVFLTVKACLKYKKLNTFANYKLNGFYSILTHFIKKSNNFKCCFKKNSLL